jgi:hypothetical protein
MRTTAARVAGTAGPTAVLLLAVVALAGPSAAVAGLGAREWHPPWDLGGSPSSGLVAVLLVVAYLLGTGCVAAGLVALRAGLVLRPQRVAALAVLAVVVLTALPATGSADHLSYLAYGRIQAEGGDPYRQDPLAWRDGTDPVAGAVAPPWQHTPSVYGPTATLLQAAVAVVGGGDLRLTAWCWQLLCGAAFLATGLVLDRVVRDDPAARTRAALLWTLNPLLLGQLVLGGHLDVVAVAFAVAAMALAARKPLVAGLFLGAAVSCKITFALFGLAALWGLRDHPRRVRAVVLGLAGTAAAMLPAHLLVGRHAYDELERASRLVSLATPWRPLVDRLDPGVVPDPDLRAVVSRVALVLGAALAVLIVRRLRAVPSREATMSAAVALAAGWLLTAPYALPWYDAMVWAPLAVIGASALDLAVLARLAVLSLAYVPGLVSGMSPPVERVSLAFRADVAPWLNLALLLAVTAWACGLRPPGRRAAPRPRAAEPAR